VSKWQARQNVAFYVIDMVLFGLAVTFLDASTVIPNFVGQITKLPVLIGLSGVWFTLLWRLPQLITAPVISRSPDKRRWMLFSSIPGRLTFLVIALLTVLISPSNRELLLIVFFIGYGIFAIADGITNNAWVALIGSAVPHRTRGIMFGVAQVITAVSILVVQGLLRQLLGPSGPGYPLNYAAVFAIAGVLLTITLPFVANFYERPMPPPTRVIGMSDYLPYLGQILRKDRIFQHYLVMRFVQDASVIAAPFFIGYEVTVLQVPSAQAVSDSLLAVMIGNLLGSALGGWLSHRFSSRLVIYMHTVAIVVGPLAALLSVSVGRDALLISFACIGLITASYGPGVFNWLVAYAPIDERPVYNSIVNTFGVVALMVPLIGGLVLQFSSYSVLFGLALVIAIAAALLVIPLRAPPSGIGELDD